PDRWLGGRDEGQQPVADVRQLPDVGPALGAFVEVCLHQGTFVATEDVQRQLGRQFVHPLAGEVTHDSARFALSLTRSFSIAVRIRVCAVPRGLPPSPPLCLAFTPKMPASTTARACSRGSCSSSARSSRASSLAIARRSGVSAMAPNMSLSSEGSTGTG